MSFNKKSFNHKTFNGNMIPQKTEGICIIYKENDTIKELNKKNDDLKRDYDKLSVEYREKERTIHNLLSSRLQERNKFEKEILNLKNNCEYNKKMNTELRTINKQFKNHRLTDKEQKAIDYCKGLCYCEKCNNFCAELIEEMCYMCLENQ